MGRCTFSSDDIVIKSPNDKKLYRLIKLENGLTALLIHDPEIYPQGSKSLEPSEEDEAAAKGGDGASETKKAAAAMCVGMGSFSDPMEAQGLAHFLEHMLFMGSTKFPVENEYNSYLSKHGGSSNAYTKEEHTCYHFDVKRDFLKGALKRFSQFFVSPLMRSEAMEREVQSIDSEFNRVLHSDLWRLQQLRDHTSSPGHPFNKFSWGNKKSLDGAKEKGINLQEQILKLYRDYYHGGLMKLVVIGGESLNVLEQWVLKLFGDIRNGPQVNLEFKAEGSIWNVGKLYRLEAVNDVPMLNLAWTLPCLTQHYLKSPEYYLWHLLAHESRGGLQFYLKTRGWAVSLSAWVESYSVAYVFGMNIYLTDSGLEKIFEIIGFVYQYIKLLRQVSPQKWIFQELQDIQNICFRFVEEQPQDDYASELAGNLLLYPAEHVISAQCVYEIWDEELIEYVLSFFRPDNMRMDVISKFSTMSKDFQCEPWFGSHYIEEDVSPFLMDLWKDPPEVNVSLHFREKNEFIPSDFSIRSDGLDTTYTSSPRCILDEPLLKFWYKLDRTFKVPRANIYFRISLKGGFDDLKSSLLTVLYIDLLRDELNEILYQASFALLDTSLYVNNCYLELKLWGFNDKLPAVLSTILTTTKKFLPTYDRFKVIKENMERLIKNTNMNPLSHAEYLKLQVLYQRFYDVDDQLHVLNGLSVSDVKSFIPELWSQLYIEGLGHGNLLEEEAISLLNMVKTIFSGQPLPTELMLKNKCICLTPDANLIRDVSVKYKTETNSVIQLCFQIERAVGIDSTRLRALIDLFDEIIDEPLYDQLRTKEQLGYVVQCDWEVIFGVFGFYFIVQSSEYNPIYLQRRVDNFINGLEDILQGLDDDSFENYRGGLMAKLLVKNSSLIHETNRFWNQIIHKRYTFDYAKRVAEELSSLQKEDVVNFYKTYLQQSSPKRRRLGIRVWGCNTDLKEAEESRPESVQVIEDLEAFKMSSEFYPHGC
ncbi:putative insulysin [Rosa chinensis]|uniref:Putative insulysin n=1 Tax=Rosa chinensis TaxID=74649 RepID=A0A2P6QKT2_ROSCH|nr:nardilysin-like isoform X1 [Rosa chinensis]PRQ34785.1 putative insulysin [Rosa chinensis]